MGSGQKFVLELRNRHARFTGMGAVVGETLATLGALGLGDEGAEASLSALTIKASPNARFSATTIKTLVRRL